MSIFNVTPVSNYLVATLPISHDTLSWIYLIATIILVKMYFLQAYKYFSGKEGVGDFHFHAKLWQLAMRSVGLVYTLYINDGGLFAVIAIDMLGRASEIGTAWYAKNRNKENLEAVAL